MSGVLALSCAAMIGFAARAQDLPLDATLAKNATRGCAENVVPPPATSQRSDAGLRVLPPVEGAYFGAYQIPAEMREAQRFADATGHFPTAVFSFHDLFADTNGSKRPDQTFAAAMEGEGSVPPIKLAQDLAGRGSVLALAWAVYCCDFGKTTFWLRLKRPHGHINRMLAGAHDDVLRDAARRISGWGGPIMLTIVPEMNWQGQFLFGADGLRWIDAVDNICAEYGDPAWPDGPERIRDLYIRVIDIFREEGADNVTWFMYSGNQYMQPGVEGQSRWLHPKYYYPGDDYIDWVGQSVYITDPAWDHGFEDTGTFDQVFLPGYAAWRSVTQKPMILPEFGLIARKGDDRRALWTDVLERSLKATPGVRAITVADSLLFELGFNIPMLSDSPAEIETLRDVLNRDSYYRPDLRLGPGG